MGSLLWILESTDSNKFPYRLSIRKGEKTLLSLFVQDRWPGAGKHVFCLRDEENIAEEFEEIEKVPIISAKRYGKRLSIVLDRSVNKRCDFLFLKKKYKNREGEYEQIFWRTQQGIKERKPRVKLTARGSEHLHILIDKNEKYPWKFTNCSVERTQLKAGDYALLSNEGIIAIVERKNFHNMIADFGTLHLLHMKLGELEEYKHSAMVVEAHYDDFLKPNKLRVYTPSYLSKVWAEIFAYHPNFQIIFAGNRKMGKEWTLRFFHAVSSQENDSIPTAVAEEASKYNASGDYTGGMYFKVRKEILNNIGNEFTINDLRERFPSVSDYILRKVLTDLKKAGILKNYGYGKSSIWRKT
ncbi:MAG: hypothetical protein FXF54_01195 [Kosmotoga sp.]|nr:MAG: hypothetical protein FXF54_01195 [Kosmotoga sp.]